MIVDIAIEVLKDLGCEYCNRYGNCNEKLGSTACKEKLEYLLYKNKTSNIEDIPPSKNKIQ